MKQTKEQGFHVAFDRVMIGKFYVEILNMVVKEEMIRKVDWDDIE